ncbi:DUF2637 domain-containing protein, partial [Streptomyces celluloflavus]|uniref:DUF2637 domain-containing protein n=1 Tax=Streptomyces celluloflavus TaxID=58344 RepID=UPI0036DEA761
MGTLVAGAIGFRMSFDTLAAVASSWGFSKDLAKWFPVGIDSSILSFSALDLYLVYRRAQWPVPRLTAHGLTALTIWFNAAAATDGQPLDHPFVSASHGAMPVLFIVGVGSVRKLLIRAARMEDGTQTDRIPSHRWILAPRQTPKLYRRMRLAGVTSYKEMLAREKDLRGYETWLRRQYGGDLSKATDDEKLPMTMAQYGYTVAQALALPDEQERAAQTRAQEDERRRLEQERAAAEEAEETERLRLAAEVRKDKAEAEAEIERLRVAGQIEQTRAEIGAQTGVAQHRAVAVRSAAEIEAESAKRAAMRAATEAERIAADEKKAEESERAAEARKRAAEVNGRAAEIEHRAAEARKVAAEVDGRAAEIEHRAAALRAQGVEQEAAAHRKADEDRKAAAEARKVAAEVNGRAAEIEHRAAETRRAAAEMERRALEAEDEA